MARLPLVKKNLENTPNLIWQMLFLAALATCLLFFWGWHSDFNLADEGFFWYGVQRVMHGEVPIRDFMAYDPGRYYWSSTLLDLSHTRGIIAVRATAAIFQALGVFIGLLTLARHTAKQKPSWWILVALTLTLWMYPWFKVFDVCCAIALVGVLAFLIDKPSYCRYFLTGMVVGLVAVFGRNHGVYGLLASLGAMAYLTIGSKKDLELLKILAAWSAGIFVGYLPVLLMVVLIPGFAQSFWNSIEFLFKVKTTNLPLPVPWPWHFLDGQRTPRSAFAGVMLGCFFIAIVTFGILSLVWVIYQKINKNPGSPVLVAATFLALPYAQYAYSRADTVHLAMGITPFLLGSFAILANQVEKRKWQLGLILGIAGLFVVLPLHSGWICETQKCVNFDIAGDEVMVTPGEANALKMLTSLTSKFAPDGRSFVVTPYWPGAYAVMKRKSPMWEIYALFPSDEKAQQAEIQRIKNANPGFILIIDSALDGRQELRFRNTHPLIDNYIITHFSPLNDELLNSEFKLYINKQNVQ